jgi:hypothetical protein
LRISPLPWILVMENFAYVGTAEQNVKMLKNNILRFILLMDYLKKYLCNYTTVKHLLKW